MSKGPRPQEFLRRLFTKGAINMSREPKEPNEEETGSAWKNIGKIIFLIAVLVAAWFILERLMGSK